MSLKFLTALACAASAFVFAAADAATFTYAFTIGTGQGSAIGSGTFVADDIGGGQFSITSATGSVASFLSDNDAVTEAVDFYNGGSATLTELNGAYSFESLRLWGNWAYDFFQETDDNDVPTGNLLGMFAESPPMASTFSITRDDAPAQTSDVPEPASWAMMVGGFGLLGAALRRKRVSVSFG